jgi:hypothetical protein
MKRTPKFDATGIAICVVTCPCAHRPWPTSRPDIVFCHGCDAKPQTEDGCLCVPAAIVAMRAWKWLADRPWLCPTEDGEGTYGVLSNADGEDGWVNQGHATPLEAVVAAMEANA